MSAEIEKQGTFLVDTKSTCFFCLEEIPPKSPPLIDLDDEEEGVATMLLEEMNRSRAGVSMEKVFKYLDIDPGAILRRQLTGGLEWAASQLMNTNIKVSVCGECERVTDSLTDMIEELEVLEKRIFNGVGRLEEVLKVSLEDPVREAVFRGKLTTPVDILQGSIADVMRKATAEKCVEHLFKPSHPQVPPVASPPPPPQVASPTTAFVSSTTTPSPPPSSGNVQLLNDDVVAKLVVQAKYKCGICDLAVTSLNSLQDHTRKKHNLRVLSASNNPSLACHTCGMELPSKEDWSNHTHQQCQAHLISTQIPPTTFSGDPSFKPHFKCSDCEDEFPTLERFEKHIQFYCKHRPSSSSTAAPPPKRSRPSNSAGKYPCPVCHSVFAHSPSLARHRRSSPRCSLNPQNSEPVPILVSTFSLAESPPTPAPTETNNAKYECEYCGNVLSCSSALGRHKRQNCVKFREYISQQQENGQSTGYVLSPQEFEGDDDWNDLDMVVEEMDDVEVEHIVVKQEGIDEVLILPN